MLKLLIEIGEFVYCLRFSMSISMVLNFDKVLTFIRLKPTSLVLGIHFSFEVIFTGYVRRAAQLSTFLTFTRCLPIVEKIYILY